MELALSHRVQATGGLPPSAQSPIFVGQATVVVKARVGDWVVVEGVTLNASTRRGQVVELRHADGSPPYPVHWVDSDMRTLVFPGPDAHVVSAEEEARRAAAAVDATAR